MLRYAIPRFLLTQPYSRQLPLSLLGAMVVAILSYLDKGRAEDVSRSLVDHQQRMLSSSREHAGTIGIKARHLHISDSTKAQDPTSLSAHSQQERCVDCVACNRSVACCPPEPRSAIVIDDDLRR